MPELDSRGIFSNWRYGRPETAFKYVCGENPERICSCLPATSVFEIETSGEPGLPLREFAGDQAITIW